MRPNYFTSDTPCADVRAQGDLWPAFINGLMDALPPGARLVDGNEHAYRYEAERGDFFKSATVQRARALSLIAPENRAKYLEAGKVDIVIASYAVDKTAQKLVDFAARFIHQTQSTIVKKQNGLSSMLICAGSKVLL